MGRPIENNYDIFKMLFADGNDKLGDMTNSDRLNILFLLKEYFLEYRSTLNLDDSIIFVID